jgi:hypothetical protein
MPRGTLSLALLLALAALMPGKDTPTKPNALTPKEIADGWILLFDGKTTFGWKVDGEAKVEKGVLTLGGKKETRAAVTTAFAGGHIVLQSTWRGKAEPTIRAGAIKGNFKGSGKDTFAEFDSSYGGGSPRSPLSVVVPAGTRVLFRSVKFNPDVGEKLFNGKDLTGWKVFKGKGKKSKYSVTKEGWLNVKDGPGDVQTTKRFDDFVLQLECFSNGKYLNSGVFFRCIPGEFWQGYEAQIQNDFSVKPAKEYKVEQYDPKTHKPAGQKMVRSAARDYGTGAIYRRVPARFGVAKDREWFTMTVVARGRHIATWVNGVQMVDWTDNRPAHDNPRKGYRAARGAISIQGHDKTTDLSFRNIRIEELPRR